MPGGGKECRTSDGFPVANDFNPVSTFQLFKKKRIDRHAPYVFNVAACDRLPVSNDRQCLQHRTTIARRLFRMQTIKILSHFGSTLETPTGGHTDQFDATLRPFLL